MHYTLTRKRRKNAVLQRFQNKYGNNHTPPAESERKEIASIKVSAPIRKHQKVQFRNILHRREKKCL